MRNRQDSSTNASLLILAHLLAAILILPASSLAQIAQPTNTGRSAIENLSFRQLDFEQP